MVGKQQRQQQDDDGSGGEEDLYDEFGNYIGPDLDDDSSSSSSESSSSSSSDDDDDDDDHDDDTSQEEEKNLKKETKKEKKNKKTSATTTTSSTSRRHLDDDDSDVSLSQEEEEEEEHDVDKKQNDTNQNDTNTTTTTMMAVDDSHSRVRVGGSARRRGTAPDAGGAGGGLNSTTTTTVSSTAIILHEDKVHYASAEEVYGDNVRTVVIDEDTMDIDTPIIEPVITKSTLYRAKSILPGIISSHNNNNTDSTTSSTHTHTTTASPWNYSDDYLLNVLLSNETTRTRRCIAIVGQLHHGKTSFIDLLLESTLVVNNNKNNNNNKKKNNKKKKSSNMNHNMGGTDGWNISRSSLDVSNGGGIRYSDITRLEQERQLSLLCTPITTLLSDIRGKSYAFTILDCPGHVNFHDECCSAIRCVDGVVLIVDVIEGIQGQLQTEMCIKQSIDDGLSICLVLNKMDRFILECKLPPLHAYYKLQSIIDDCNTIIQKYSHGKYPMMISPERNNVIFASSIHGWSFTLQSFVQQTYIDHIVHSNSNSNDDDDDDDDDNYNNNNNNNNAGGGSSSTIFGHNLSVDEFAKRLWGSTYINPNTGTFHKTASQASSRRSKPTTAAAASDDGSNNNDTSRRRRSKFSSSSDTDTTTTAPVVERTFVKYILEPIYKIYSVCIGERSEPNVNQLLRSLGIFLNREQLRSNARILLRIAMSKFLQTTTTTTTMLFSSSSNKNTSSSTSSTVGGFVDSIVKNIPYPKMSAYGKLSRCYTGSINCINSSSRRYRHHNNISIISNNNNNNTNKKNNNSNVVQSMLDCNSNGPFVMHCVKNYYSDFLHHDGHHHHHSNMNDHDDNNNNNNNNETSSSSSFFWTFGRIYSGTIQKGQKVYVLGESYHPVHNTEDMSIAIVQDIAIPRGRYCTSVNIAKAGNWILIAGVDKTITNTATVVDATLIERNTMNDDDDDDDDNNLIHIFKPLTYHHVGNESIMKLSIEPLNPAELPKMIYGLRCIQKSYPMLRTQVEESGEHNIIGTGELYLDCALYDLRNIYGGGGGHSGGSGTTDPNNDGSGSSSSSSGTTNGLEIKVSDPIVSFRETVIETSSRKCYTTTTNKRNKIAYIAEPLDDGLAIQLEKGRIKMNVNSGGGGGNSGYTSSSNNSNNNNTTTTWDNKKLGHYFQTKYNWDLLSSRSIWAFGDSSTHGTNILLDDTLPSEVNKSSLFTCRNFIIQGFQWATREGPLCDEPVRSTKIKILDGVFADKPIYRSGGQIIPASRKTVHSAILSAQPRLMEPIYRVQMQFVTKSTTTTTSDGSDHNDTNGDDIMNTIQPILRRRRGYIVNDYPISATCLHIYEAFLPVLDSFGYETDIRTVTQGRCSLVQQIFDHWSIVPGDPLDNSILLHPLEPSPPQHLARELLIKTRRRKGLSDDVML